MSTYVTMQGQVTYPSDEAFNQMVETLKSGGWVDHDGYFVDECGTQVMTGKNSDPNYSSDDDPIEADPDINPVSRTITIPCCHYRNLGAVDFFQNKTAKGEIIGTCTDGCFIGWYSENGEEQNFDLEKWAAENLEDDDRFPPKESECSGPDDYGQNLVAWQSLVEQEFHDEPV